MRGSGFVIALTLLVTLSGCMSDTPPVEPGFVYTEDGRILYSATPPTPDEAARRTLDALPVYTEGETFVFHYWHVRTAIEAEAAVTVAYSNGTTYGFGIPADQESTRGMDPLITHLPPIGLVGFHDLAWRVHDKTFRPLDFPLELGKTWDTSWQNDGDAVTAEVVAIEGQRATVEMIGPSRHIHLTYDAREGMITKFEVIDYGGFELIDHHHDPGGHVVVPLHHEPVILDSRFPGATDRDGSTALPAETYTVEAGHGGMATMVMLGTTVPTVPSRQAVHLIDGPVMDAPWRVERQYVPGISPQFEAWLGHSKQTHGDWTFAYEVDGPGAFATVEYIAYIPLVNPFPTAER